MKIGLWSWNLPYDQHDWWPSYLDKIVASGAKVWIPKILDGEGYYNGVRLEPATLYAVQYGLNVWCWGYERDGRFADPTTEGAKLGTRAQALHASAVIADVEAEWTPDDPSVEPFLRSVKAGFSGRGPVYFSSYSTVRYHPDFPWTQFIAHTDGVIPQDYQAPAGQWLDESIADLTAKGAKTILPVGLVDDETELLSFLEGCADRGLSPSLWSIDRMSPRAWAIVKEYASD